MWQEQDETDDKKSGAGKWFWLVALTIGGSFLLGGVMFYSVFHSVNQQIDRVWQSIDRFDEQFDREEKEMMQAMKKNEAHLEKNRQEFAQRLDDFQKNFHQDMHQKQDDFAKELKNRPEQMAQWSRQNQEQMMTDFKGESKAFEDRMQENFGLKPLAPLTGKETHEELQRCAAIARAMEQRKKEIIAQAANRLMSAKDLKEALPELSDAQVKEITTRYDRRPLARITTSSK